MNGQRLYDLWAACSVGDRQDFLSLLNAERAAARAWVVDPYTPEPPTEPKPKGMSAEMRQLFNPESLSDFEWKDLTE